MTVIDFKRIKISRNTVGEYKLILKGRRYTVECKEYDCNGRIKDFASVDDITTDSALAHSIFDKLTLFKVSACTLLDIVCDLIC